MPVRKHILFVSSWYPKPADPTWGIFNKHFARAASLYNLVTVLHILSDETLTEKYRVEETTEDSILTVRIFYKKDSPALPIISQIKKFKRVLVAFEKGFRKVVDSAGKPDLIQLNVAMPMGIGVHHLFSKYRIPYVLNECWSGYCAEDGNYKGLIQQFFTRRIVKDARIIMPTSSYLQDAMLSHGLKGEYTIVPNVVDTELFKPESHPSTGRTRLIHISSLNDREKNVSGLINAFAKALKINSQLELDIVGEGIDKLKYEKLVTDLHINNKVHFVGRLLSEELVKKINLADVLIMFSNFETFSVVIIEAFACGKPVITSNAGAIKSYMKPELGIMVNKNDEPMLTDAILKFAENKQSFSSALIRKYAVENYSYQKVGGMLDEIYKRALK